MKKVIKLLIIVNYLFKCIEFYFVEFSFDSFCRIYRKQSVALIFDQDMKSRVGQNLGQRTGITIRYIIFVMFMTHLIPSFLKISRRVALGFYLLALVPDNAKAQHNLSVQVEKQLSVQQATNYKLFSVSSNRSVTIDQRIKNVTYLTLDREQLRRLTANNDGLVVLSIPLMDEKEISFQLMRYDFRTKDYRTIVKTAEGYTTIANPDGDFYRGAIKGTAASMAAFSFYEEEVGAVFSEQVNGNYNLVLNKENPGAHNENYILYREDDIEDKSKRSSCAMTDDIAGLSGDRTGGEKTAAMGIYETECNTVRVSVFADDLLYRQCSSSVVKSVQYMNTLFNVVSALYANDNLFLNLSETVISTVYEGYSYTSSTDVLNLFGNLVQTYAYNGDVAHMMTGYRTGSFAPLGGLAWLNVLCQSPVPITLSGESTYYGPYSMGNVYANPTIPGLPTYSWDVEVTAHEIGHNIGSPHTQSCTWPTGPIDGCVDPEGACTTVVPLPVGGGTIMSYCHLKASVGINFANGFGPQPRALLKSKITGAACLRSGVSDSTLSLSGKTIIANAECNDGVWSHYFFDNNTSDLSDDIMVLSLKKGSLDIGNTSDPAFLIKMTTDGFYAKDTVPALTVAYADTNWYEINRKWTIQLPAGKQPATAVTVRYPYLAQDVKDISKVLLLKAVSDTNLVFLKYANDTPVTSLLTATTADVRRIENSTTAASVKNWYAGVSGAYKYVEVILDSGVYGGTLGYQIDNSWSAGIKEASSYRKINIHPNPAHNSISIDAPAGNTGVQNVLIYDNLGRILYNESMPFVNDKLTIDISNLSNGIYMLKCLGTQSSLNGLFLKQ